MHFLAIRRGSTKPGDPRQAQIVTLRAATHGNDVVVAYLSVAEDAPGEKTHDKRLACMVRARRRRLFHDRSGRPVLPPGDIHERMACWQCRTERSPI